MCRIGQRERERERDSSTSLCFALLAAAGVSQQVSAWSQHKQSGDTSHLHSRDTRWYQVTLGDSHMEDHTHNNHNNHKDSALLYR